MEQQGAGSGLKKDPDRGARERAAQVADRRAAQCWKFALACERAGKREAMDKYVYGRVIAEAIAQDIRSQREPDPEDVP